MCGKLCVLLIKRLPISLSFTLIEIRANATQFLIPEQDDATTLA